MDAIAFHREVRNAISLSDELGRYEHAVGNDDLAAYLAAIRTALDEIERDVGRSYRRHPTATRLSLDKLERAINLFRRRIDEVAVAHRARFWQLIASLERILFVQQQPSSPIPAKPLLGVLPIRRAIPQTVHSIVDYASAGAYLLSAAVARTPEARAMGLILGGATAGVSLFTDSHLSATKKIPIELHEIYDHASVAAAIIAPFALGYVKRDPLAAAIQIAAGICSVLTSLVTDYRAERGVSLAVRHNGVIRKGQRVLPALEF